jgi:hypothetical protein
MLVLESMVIFYLCSDVVHIGIGVYVDVLDVTPYMLVVEFAGRVTWKRDACRLSSQLMYHYSITWTCGALAL